MIESALRSKVDPATSVENFGYFFPSIRAQGLRIEWPADTLAVGQVILDRLCHTIQQGAFLATNEKDDCRFCDYQSICGDVQQVADRSARLLAQHDVVPLQDLRELRRG